MSLQSMTGGALKIAAVYTRVKYTFNLSVGTFLLSLLNIYRIYVNRVEVTMCNHSMAELITYSLLKSIEAMVDQSVLV